MRWIGIFLLFVTLMIGGVWYKSEEIAKRLIHDQLVAVDFELLTFRLSRPTLSGLRAAHIRTESKTLKVDIRGLSITPLTEGEFYLAVDKIQIEALSDDNAQSEPETLRALWNQVQETLPLVPALGSINELILCQLDQCESMNVNWSRSSEGVAMRLTHPSRGVTVELTLNDQWHFDWVVDSSPSLSIGQLNLLSEGDRFLATSQASSALNLNLDLLEVDGLSGTLGTVFYEVQAEVPQDETTGTLLTTLTARGKLRVNFDWLMSVDDAQIQSAGQLQLALSYEASRIKAMLNGLPTIQIEHPMLDSGYIQLGGDHQCEIELDTMAVSSIQCDLRQVNLSANDGSLAAELVLDNLVLFYNQQHQGFDGQLNMSVTTRSGTEVFTGIADLAVQDVLVDLKLEEGLLWGAELGLTATHNIQAGTGVYNTRFSGKLPQLAAPIRQFVDPGAADAVGAVEGGFNFQSNGEYALNGGNNSFSLQHETFVSLSNIETEFEGIQVRSGSVIAGLSGWPVIEGHVKVSDGQELYSGKTILTLEDNRIGLVLGGGFASDGVKTPGAAKLLGNSFDLVANHYLEEGAGDYRMKISGKVSNLLEPIKRFADAEIVEVAKGSSGRFELSSGGDWRLAVTGQSDLLLQHQTQLDLGKFDLEYDGYTLERGKLTARLSGWPAIAGDVLINVPSASVGVEIQSIDMGFKLYLDPGNNITTLFGGRLKLNVLGGTISSQQFGYDLGTGNGGAMFSAEQLQLPEILALQRQDFTCSGVVSGSVPVQLTAGILTVTDAALAAEKPGGFVRYQPDQSVSALAEQNSGLSVVLAAMNNFQYHTLTAAVDYSADGLMTARTSIKGANPQYQEGREVYLNLNLEENIKKLLESLRLGTDVAEKIGEKTTGRPND